jgi:molecular chaperone GrpE (heat shock protein)
MTNKTPVELVEEGKKRLEALRQRQHRVEVQLETKRNQLKDAQVEAAIEFETDDLTKLRELFKTREEANAAAALEFIMALDDIDAALRRTEQALSN